MGDKYSIRAKSAACTHSISSGRTAGVSARIYLFEDPAICSISIPEKILIWPGARGKWRGLRVFGELLRGAGVKNSFFSELLKVRLAHPHLQCYKWVPCLSALLGSVIF